METEEEIDKLNFTSGFIHGQVAVRYFYCLVGSMQGKKSYNYFRNKLEETIKVFERTFKPFEKVLNNTQGNIHIENYFDDSIILMEDIIKLGDKDFREVQKLVAGLKEK